MKRRITTNEELLDFTIERYKHYRQVADDPNNRDNVTKWYINDLLSDLLLIQNYAHNETIKAIIGIPNEPRVE